MTQGMGTEFELLPYLLSLHRNNEDVLKCRRRKLTKKRRNKKFEKRMDLFELVVSLADSGMI